MSLTISLIASCDLGGEKPLEIKVFTISITANLTGMAQAAGLYHCLWKPDEIHVNLAFDAIESLRAGLMRLKTSQKLYEQYDPPSGYGDYDNLMNVVEEYLKACLAYPNTFIRIS